MTPAAIEALQNALAAEHAAVYGYGVAGAHLTGPQQAEAMSAWNDHRARRDQLAAMLAAQGAIPAAAAAAYRLPFPVTSALAAAAFTAALEDGITRAYLGLVGLAASQDQSLRTFGALAMQDAAVRAAQWLGATVAFPGLPRSAVARQSPHAAGRGTPS
ncbi:MAG TPA: ferritin-like domain-containing protein [Streptosporangiaceae bacterium]|nr:ferritin-like domain-containing protein [Streptosporangiaceae bacterium]